jgi:hypothetical protein
MAQYIKYAWPTLLDKLNIILFDAYPLYLLMANTQGFYKVVRASAVTHRKLQISKVVTPPIPD